MCLAEAKIGQEVTVSEFKLSKEAILRLIDIGLHKGAKVKIKGAAPLGDPILVSVKDFCLALRKSDAKNIIVYSGRT
jgi:Fe2+ transport system protein FeoA